MILSAVLYGCETWCVRLKGEYRLGLFKNRVVWKILGPKRDEVCPSVCPHGTTRLPADRFW
jgi:hypothetical protein